MALRNSPGECFVAFVQARSALGAFVVIFLQW